MSTPFKGARAPRRHTGSTTDIIEGELRDTGVELQQQRQRLANATGSTEDSDLGGLVNGAVSAETSMDHVSRSPTWLAEAEKARFWKRLTV